MNEGRPDWFDQLDRLIRHLEYGLLSVIFFALLGLGLIQLGTRVLDSETLSWTDPAMRALVLWLVMIGGVVASRELRHIRIDLLDQLVPAALLPWMQRLTSFAAALICLALTWTSLGVVALEYEFRTTAFLAVPNWQVQVIVPIGFGLMAARFLAWFVSPPGIALPPLEDPSKHP